ncbi:hypothetical protein EVAR_63102_1 [Eumeta japonica]|uniref:Uncharacterized protein n=1 Tax=Eumeta variegata TaxID=151549 RepID=A0A4C1ZHE2_EUMVA|nr:hypothetical protein EVAR_63102_1 [Eumeta japonica]
MWHYVELLIRSGFNALTRTRVQEAPAHRRESELKASNELCNTLVSKRDDHEIEIQSVIFFNTELKGELAELDIKCNDLTDQRDRLQAQVNEMNDRREHYEHSLLQIQSLQAELHSNRMRPNKLQHKMNVYELGETVKLCDSILNGTALIDMANPI